MNRKYTNRKYLDALEKKPRFRWRDQVSVGIKSLAQHMKALGLAPHSPLKRTSTH